MLHVILQLLNELYMCICIITLPAIIPSIHYCYTQKVGRKLDHSVSQNHSSILSFLHFKDLKISNKMCLWLSRIRATF